MNSLKKIRKGLLLRWRQIIFALVAIAVSLGLLLVNLAHQPQVFGPLEQSWLDGSSSLSAIFAHPLDVPLRLLQFGAGRIASSQHLLTMRIPSVLLGLIAVGLLVYVLQRWYGPRSTVFGFWLFVCSAWFLHVGRLAGPGIEYMVIILALLALHKALQDHEDNVIMLYVWLAVTALFITVPGAIWLLALGLAWQWRAIAHLWLHAARLWSRILWLALACAMIGTVAYGFVRQPSTIMTWLALPEHLSSWRDPLHSLVAVLQAFTYQGPHVPELWLGNLVLIDWFILAMFVAGIVFYARHWKASRTHLLASFFATSIVVCALLGPVSYGLVLVIIYLVAIAGIAYVLQFWLKVFPRNPLARSFGVAVVSCAIGLSCLYGLTQYFVAWPHNPDTQSLYYQQSHLPREQPAKS